MKENVGRLDQALRFAATPALLALGYALLGSRKTHWAGLVTVVGTGMLVESAITRVCPTNRLLGLDTRSEKLKRRDVKHLKG